MERSGIQENPGFRPDGRPPGYVFFEQPLSVLPRAGGVVLMIDDRWLSVDEIAAYLGVKRDTVYKWIERKSMPSHKVGRLWKFRRSEVDEWVTSGRGGRNVETGE